MCRQQGCECTFLCTHAVTRKAMCSDEALFPFGHTTMTGACVSLMQRPYCVPKWPHDGDAQPPTLTAAISHADWHLHAAGAARPQQAGQVQGAVKAHHLLLLLQHAVAWGWAGQVGEKG